MMKRNRGRRRRRVLDSESESEAEDKVEAPKRRVSTRKRRPPVRYTDPGSQNGPETETEKETEEGPKTQTETETEGGPETETEEGPETESERENTVEPTRADPGMFIEDEILLPVETLRAASTPDGYVVRGGDDTGCWCYAPQDCLDHLARTHECRAHCRERHERLVAFLQGLPPDETLHSDHEQTFAPGQLADGVVELEVGTDIRFHFSLDALTVSRMAYLPLPKPDYERQLLVQLLDCGSDGQYAHLASVVRTASAPERVPGHYGVCVACNRRRYITWAMRSLETPGGALGSECARRLALAHSLIHAQTDDARLVALDACKMYFMRKYE